MAIKNSWRVRLKPLEVESEIQDDCANSWGCGGGSSQNALRTNQSRRYAESKSCRITFDGRLHRAPSGNRAVRNDR